ncbi:hypothetical protein KFE96_06720 [Kordiimonas sp. SCSIO 12603]|uniref:phage tail protein n=1 Tax=Kordiimonas sp. SCSIO 12603 TaxID=2829596 RepID=UPI002107284B|nr:phage tail protein [Kordiimonas sp. SCSIO 12603]UTW59994.1 hypothetical protein KFE96_06720 [Kordiimonas sp. SCSIO 12603]
MGFFSFIGGLLGLGGPTQTIEISKAAAARGLPVVYGKKRLEAITIFKDVNGKIYNFNNSGYDHVAAFGSTEKHRKDKADHDYLHRVDVWCLGPIEGIEKFWVDGYLSTEPRFSRRMYFRGASKYGGSKNSTAAGGLTANSRWRSNYLGKGVAYTYSRFYHSWKRPQFDSEPELTALIKGVRVYDPRESSQSASNSDSWAYSNNLALVVLNYLMADYGYGANASEIDFDSFRIAADICDGKDVRPSAAGASLANVKLHVNIALDPKDGVVKNIKKLLEGTGWSLPWSNGKFKLILERAIDNDEIAMRFDADSIIGNWNIERGMRADRLNRITIEYKEAAKDYEKLTVSWPKKLYVGGAESGVIDPSSQYGQFLSEDFGRELHTNISIDTITDRNAAIKLAKYKVLKSRVRTRITGLELAPKAMLLEPGDVIELDFPDKIPAATSNISEPDLGPDNDPSDDDRANKFIVERVTVSPKLDVKVDLLEYAPEVYGEEPLEDLPEVDSPFNPERWDSPPAVENAQATVIDELHADGSIMRSIELTWDQPDGAISLSHYDIEWRKRTPASTPLEVSSDGDVVLSGQYDDEGSLVEYEDFPNHMQVLGNSVSARIENVLNEDVIYDVAITYRTQRRQTSDAVLLQVDTSAAKTRLDEIPVYVGVYSPSATYQIGNLVTFEGSSYVYIGQSPGNGGQPPSSIWALLASVGGYRDTVFRRAASRPSTPSGTNPSGWSDGPPAANGQPLWMSTSLRGADNSIVKNWTVPQEVGGSGLEVQYSSNGSNWHEPPFISGVDLFMQQRLSGGSWSPPYRIVGEAGARGSQGPQGPQGPAGAVWHSGTGYPSSSLGSVGDYYLRTSTGDIFVKTSSTFWRLDGNLKGGDGDRWHSGSGAPSSGLGSTGDFYLRRDTNQVYQKTSGGWQLNFALTDSLGALASLDVVNTGDISDGAVSEIVPAPNSTNETFNLSTSNNHPITYLNNVVGAYRGTQITGRVLIRLAANDPLNNVNLTLQLRHSPGGALNEKVIFVDKFARSYQISVFDFGNVSGQSRSYSLQLNAGSGTSASVYISYRSLVAWTPKK